MGKIKISELMRPLSLNDDESSDESSDSDQEIDPNAFPQNNNPGDLSAEETAELNRIITEINQAIASGEAIDLDQYPPLYVVHYRGTHFFRPFFNQHTRRSVRTDIREGNFEEAIYSPAVYDLARVEFGHQLPDDLTNIKNSINDEFTEMENTAPRRLFWAGNRRQHANLLYQHYQRFVNNYQEFRQESEEPEVRYQCYTLLPSRKNSYVATADDPRHAIFYALGGKSEFEHGSLRPAYLQPHGRAKHPKVGYVQIILHTLPELIEQKPLMLSSLHAYNAIDIDGRLLNERETSFRACIPAENVVASHVVRYPSFNVDYSNRYHVGKYGIAQKSSFTRFGNSFKNYNRDEAPNAQSGLLDTLAARYANRFEQHAKQIVRERGGFLVYVGLDGRLHRTLPATSEISAQRGRSKRQRIMDTPLYDNLELIRSQPAPRPQG